LCLLPITAGYFLSCTVSEPSKEIPLFTTSAETALSAEAMQKIIDDFRAMQPKEVTKNIEEGNPPGKEDFNINDYFNVLTHLSMEPGYVLDYIGLYDIGFGGRPIIYVRKKIDNPFSSFKAFESALNPKNITDNIFSFVSVVMGGNDLSDCKIRIDGSKEGFFEYIVLQEMGRQFYLSWHAHYDDATVICADSGLQKAIEEAETSFSERPLPEDVMRRIRYLKLEPTVTFDGDSAIVKITVFTKWGGFFRSVYTIDRNYPHEIKNIQGHKIIEYDCGVTF
jgi:hypothetical protein